jgi:formylglycine-generating enzyme required for sulfatase activity
VAAPGPHAPDGAERRSRRETRNWVRISRIRMKPQRGCHEQPGNVLIKKWFGLRVEFESVRDMTDLLKHRIAALIVASILCAGWASQGWAAMNAGDAGQSFRDCSQCPTMVVVPSGRFSMGSSPAEGAQLINSVSAHASVFDRFFFWTREALVRRDVGRAQPQHTVTIAEPFAIGKYPVTRAEFAAFVRETGYSMRSGACFDANRHFRKLPKAGWQSPGFLQTDRDPVLCVSWTDAQAYVAWLNTKASDRTPNSKLGGPYSLPTEAEFEYAARAGTRTAYWWGEGVGSDNADCNGCGSRWDNEKTAPVGSFQANPFHLYDMLGNVWEWMADCWNANYTGAPTDGRAWTAGNCSKRVVRAGSWTGEPWSVRSATRGRFDIDDSGNIIGFRVVRNLMDTVPKSFRGR